MAALNKLTELEIRQAKPKERDFKIADGGGMFLQVKRNGSKYWRLKYRFTGKEKLLALGVYPESTLKQVRQLRDEARQKIANNVDLSIE